MLHAMAWLSDQQAKWRVSLQGSLSALVGPCTDPPPAQAAAQPLRDARSALKAPLLPLLGGPKFSCCSSSQSKWPAFCSRSEGQASWMDFADEGRNWEGAELIPQLYAESSFTGTASHSSSPVLGKLRKPLSHAKAWSCPIAILRLLAPGTSQHPDPFFPAALRWTGFPTNRAVQQHFIQCLQCCLQLNHTKVDDMHQYQHYQRWIGLQSNACMSPV